METAKQLSVRLLNKPGRLADMLAALAKDKVTIRGMTVMDSNEHGVVRFVPEDAQTAIAALEKSNIRCDAAEVLLVELPTQSGSFRKMCERLAAEHLNIDYAYCAFEAIHGRAGMLAVVRVNNLAKAQRVLSETGTPSKSRLMMRPRGQRILAHAG